MGKSVSTNVLVSAEAPPPRPVAQATRAVVSDAREIRLVLYDHAGAVALVSLTPTQALLLAHKLLEVALRRLPPFLSS